MSLKFRLGLFLFFGFICAGSLVVWKSDIRIRQTSLRLVGEFQHIGGLKKGADVRYRGYKVGVIEKIIPYATHIDVLFFVNKTYHVPKNSTCKIMFDGLVGQNYLGIQPHLYEKKYMSEGERMKGILSSDLAHFLDLGSKGLLQVDKILASINKIIGSSDHQKSFSHILDNMEGITTGLNDFFSLDRSEGVASFFESINHIQHISSVLDQQITSLFVDGNMGEDLAVLVRNLSKISVFVSESGNQGVSFLDSENQANFKSMLKELNELSQYLNTYFKSGGSKQSSGLIQFLRRMNQLFFYTQTDLLFNRQSQSFYYDLSLFVQSGKSFLKASFGDRYGVNQFLDFQQGFYFKENFDMRFGLFNLKPGIGFDFFPSSWELTLDLYNPNFLDVDFFVKRKVMEPLFVKFGVVNDPATRDWNNFLLGFSLGL